MIIDHSSAIRTLSFKVRLVLVDVTQIHRRGRSRRKACTAQIRYEQLFRTRQPGRFGPVQLAKSIHSENSVASRRLKRPEQLGLQSKKKCIVDISAILAPIFENS